jgi:serine/threonine protein kinase
METRLPAGVAVCSVCGEPLNAKGDCLACLLRTGLQQTVVEIKPSALAFGDFEVEQHADGSYWELGRGVISVTYLAADKVLRRRVALKVIEVPAAARGSRAMRERFLREARAAAALRHPNVAAVFQFGATPAGTHCYYAMEFVEGETLGARVRRDGPLNAKRALEVAIQVTRALMAAAVHGLIHRDLKPSNIMLTTESEVKVIDFGLVKAITDAGGEMDLTQGEFVGTPTFASPEQFGSGPVDARSDIYSLGATLWFALTGLAPHFGKTLEEIRDRKTRDDLPVAQLDARKVPEPLVRLLRSTLAIDPGERPASARELMEALESCRRKLTRHVGAAYQKPALRSDAFARALTDAKACVSDPDSLQSLFHKAARKAASVSRKPFKENWAYLQTMLRLIRAYYRGEYRQVSDDALLWIIAALKYLVDPFDLIPDKTPFLGFVDDANVVELVKDKTRRTLDDFMKWETTQR